MPLLFPLVGYAIVKILVTGMIRNGEILKDTIL